MSRMHKKVNLMADEVSELEEELPKGPENETEEVLHCTYPGCLKEFGSRWSLTRHIRTHTGERPFRCKDCGKEFVQKCSLKRHEQTHSDDKQWVCNYPDCSKKFKLKEYLEVHKRTHLRLPQEGETSSKSSSNLSAGTPVDFPNPNTVTIDPVKDEEAMDMLKALHTMDANKEAVDNKRDGSQDADLDTAGMLFDQLRQRLVRMSVRHREMMFTAHQKEYDLQVNLGDCFGALLDSVTLLNAIAPESVPPHINSALSKFGKLTEVRPEMVPPP